MAVTSVYMSKIETEADKNDRSLEKGWDERNTECQSGTAMGIGD